jgi:hypothetical protein
MVFGKRLQPPQSTIEAIAVVQEKTTAPVETPAVRRLAERIDDAGLEFFEVLIEAFQTETTDGRQIIHRSSVAAVAAAVAGQMAVRAVLTERALDSMPETLPPGAADGAIYAKVGRGDETLFDQLLFLARKRIPSDELPNPSFLAQRLPTSSGLSIPVDHFPQVNALTVMKPYDAIAMQIARREGLDRTSAMLMAGNSLVRTLRDERDDDVLVILMRLSLEIMLHSARINPRRRD